MKTPRELLFERHQDAAAKLDAVRRGVIEGLTPAKPVREPCAAGSAVGVFFVKAWLELIWPSRRAWATIAILWAGVLVWNVAEKDPRVPEGTRTGAKSHMVQNLATQRHLLAELLESVPQRTPEPARPKTRPRTDMIPSFKFC